MEIQLVEDMEIRNVTRDDLPRLAEIISCEELITREDICFEYSKLMTDTVDGEDNVILAFILVRQRPVRDFFGGRIPDEIIPEDDEDYEEGDEFAFREEIEENFSDNEQFEVVYSYERKDANEVFKVYTAITYEGVLLWCDNENVHINSVIKEYAGRHFNNVISCDIPFYY